jgi:hypothetical protein
MAGPAIGSCTTGRPWPAGYGNSGIMTFMINHLGDPHEAGLGEHTAESAAAIDDCDPGEGWMPVLD